MISCDSETSSQLDQEKESCLAMNYFSVNGVPPVRPSSTVGFHIVDEVPFLSVSISRTLKTKHQTWFLLLGAEL